ncbi:uncharacterized protein LOC134635582 [Pelmatolapia mariae]|uniref:uncharacterized protein LOC134635582 n=1 Tax=Pelmatolapia mariae TaxID=158779 RepID=UPI002FE58A5D
MAVWDKNLLWSFMFLLAGAVGQTVMYPFTSTCAVRGSTVTFTPRRSFKEGKKNIPLKIVRVRWCKNHEICHGGTPSVYDSDSANNDPCYQYLGDMKTNCTLQIRDVQQGDNATFRFRMEADHHEGHFTNQTGVTVRVDDSTKMRIIRSSDDKKLSRGETVTLLCASLCTFHQLELTWLKDGHTLSDTGPSFHLHSLTAEDSGSYTCALKKNMKAVSEPYSLQVESDSKEEAETGGNLPLIAGVKFVVLLAVIALVLFIIERKLRAAEGQRAAGGETELKHPDNVNSNIQEQDDQQETSRAVEDVSYSSVHFTQKKQEGRQMQKVDDAVVYSSIAK